VTRDASEAERARSGVVEGDTAGVGLGEKAAMTSLSVLSQRERVALVSHERYHVAG
jgi:hypothetical protein